MMFTDTDLANRGLPPIAYMQNERKGPEESPVIGIKRGRAGYWPIWTRTTADELNRDLGVTQAQVEAMHAGSIFGWACPASYPSVYIKEKS